MSNLVDFAKRVEQTLAATQREPHWEPGEAERYMADVEVRRGRFDEAADRLNSTVVQPRLETLASYFSNASLTRNDPAGHCADRKSTRLNSSHSQQSRMPSSA